MPSGLAPPRLRMTRRSARPIVAFALMLPPKQAVPPLMPSRPAIGPLTMMTGAAPPVVHAVEPTWNSGWSTARTLASTTGKYSGPAARHHGVGGDFLDGDRALERLHAAEHLVGRARRPVQHRRHERLGRRDDGEAVGPNQSFQRFVSAGEVT